MPQINSFLKAFHFSKHPMSQNNSFLKSISFEKNNDHLKTSLFCKIFYNSIIMDKFMKTDTIANKALTQTSQQSKHHTITSYSLHHNNINYTILISKKDI